MLKMQSGYLHTHSQDPFQILWLLIYQANLLLLLIRIWRLVIYPFGIPRHCMLLKLLIIFCLMERSLHIDGINNSASPYASSAPIPAQLYLLLHPKMKYLKLALSELPLIYTQLIKILCNTKANFWLQQQTKHSYKKL